jgi:hypothetical protein
LCGITFAAAYLVELAPALAGVHDLESARQLLDSVCMSFPRSLGEALGPVP